MSKKILFLMLILMLTASLFIGCGSPEVTEEEPENGEEIQEEPVDQVQINIITGSTGGTYFALGGAMANTWNDHIDSVQVTSQPGGASVESINRVHAGEVELGMAMNNIADDAWNGNNSFESEQQNFRAIGVIYPEVFQGVALQDSGITQLEDVAGNKVAVGPVGSGTMVLTEAVFTEAGLSFDDVQAAFDGFGDAASKMKDNQLDAAFNVLSVPAAAIQDIMTSRDINVIEISDELYAKLGNKYPFFTQYIIPAGTYGNEEDVKTINCQAALYCSPNLPEDMVYELTKVWAEKCSETASAHAAAQWLADEMAAGNKNALIDGITTPLHPGAYRYYQEQGIEVPDAAKPID